jgi:hypothetical protein
VGVAAETEASSCTVLWGDGTPAEALPVRDGVCTARRVVRRPGIYDVAVAAAGAEVRTRVVVYDPRAGGTAGSGVSDGLRFSLEAAYVPWRKTPAPMGEGAFDGPDGLSARVTAVEWLVVTPEHDTAVKGTAVTDDGTRYGFVLFGEGTGRFDLADWKRLPAHPAGTEVPRPGRLPVMRPAAVG